jgi:GWxTD domain-containing protein
VALSILALTGLIAFGSAVGGARVEQMQPSIALSVVRFYRPELRQTRVKAFIQIPYILLQPSGEGPSGRMSYTVAVKVRDSSALTLVDNAWQGHAPAEARQPGASALEVLDFGLAPGDYRLEVSVTDSLSGRSIESAVAMEGFKSEPALSDLLLAPKIRPATAEDVTPGPGEIRRGSLLITGSAELLLTPLRSRAFYLVEAYSAKADSGSLTMTVIDSSGKTLISTPPSTTQLAAGGGVLTGSLDLAGLPAGAYRMKATLSIGGQTVERVSPFVMADLAETVAKDVARREASRVTDEGYFADLSEEQLDEAQRPLSYIAKSGELSVYNKKLSLAAKRKFMTDFWRQRDPTPATPRNESREQFYQSIELANRTFREGGRAGQSGWRTDRGRVYAKYGVPDEVLRRSQQGKAPPYEAWRYSTGKGRYFVFADRTGFGAYNLIATNELQERGIPHWQSIVGLDVVQDIGRFLGVDLLQTGPGINY